MAHPDMKDDLISLFIRGRMKGCLGTTGRRAPSARTGKFCMQHDEPVLTVFQCAPTSRYLTAHSDSGWFLLSCPARLQVTCPSPLQVGNPSLEVLAPHPQACFMSAAPS